MNQKLLADNKFYQDFLFKVQISITRLSEIPFINIYFLKHNQIEYKIYSNICLEIKYTVIKTFRNF